MRREDLHELAQKIADQLDREEEARSGGGHHGHDVSNQPRVPAGNSDGGEWTDGGGGGSGRRTSGGGVAPNRMKGAPPSGQGASPQQIDSFFKTMEPIAQRIADACGVPKSWILGLSVHESWWMGDHARDLNNPFGQTKGGHDNIGYQSLDDAERYWIARWGSAAAGATTPDQFTQRLKDAGYNSKDPDWKTKVLRGIQSVERRRQMWDRKGE